MTSFFPIKQIIRLLLTKLLFKSQIALLFRLLGFLFLVIL